MITAYCYRQHDIRAPAVAAAQTFAYGLLKGKQAKGLRDASSLPPPPPPPSIFLSLHHFCRHSLLTLFPLSIAGNAGRCRLYPGSFFFWCTSPLTSQMTYLIRLLKGLIITYIHLFPEMWFNVSLLMRLQVGRAPGFAKRRISWTLPFFNNQRAISSIDRHWPSLFLSWKVKHHLSQIRNDILLQLKHVD